jgi:RimJ/RimL family protein N-acetyltransferase
MELPVLPSGSGLEILTPRLKLVPMVRAHAAIMFPILSDSRLYAFTGGSPPVSEESLAAIYTARESRRSPDGAELWLNWLLWEREGGEGIGYAQATVHAAHAYVAWVVGTQWQNLGHASGAAAALVRWLHAMGVPEIRACVNPAHSASRRVARNAGLQQTGTVVDGEGVWSCRRNPRGSS